MADVTTRISRPRRWDVPFGERMSEQDVARLLQIPPFSKIDESRFPPTIPFHGVLLNDARIRKFERGDIIVREGDYGSSAFFILHGAVRVVLDSLPANLLGRRPPQKKSFFRSLAQLWSNPAQPEVRHYSHRDAASGLADVSLKTRAQEGDEVRIFLQDVPGVLDQNHTARLGEGELFGEIAAISRVPRTATVIAEETVELLELRWQGLREIRKYAPEWKQQIDQLYRERSLVTHLRETPLLKKLSDEDLATVAEQTQFESYGEFEWNASYRSVREGTPQERLAKEPVIAREGDYPNGLILIRNGFARLSRKYNHGERTISYLGKGDVFGLASLLSNARSNEPTGLEFSLRAIGYVDILVVPTPIVEQFIAPRLSEEEISLLHERTKDDREIDVEADA
ncbi:MAG: cyclic nucleotide-binding domain-containing protein, partial [Verrucomicrobiota bacterium]